MIIRPRGRRINGKQPLRCFGYCLLWKVHFPARSEHVYRFRCSHGSLSVAATRTDPFKTYPLALALTAAFGARISWAEPMVAVGMASCSSLATSTPSTYIGMDVVVQFDRLRFCLLENVFNILRMVGLLQIGNFSKLLRQKWKIKLQKFLKNHLTDNNMYSIIVCDT